MMTHNLSQQMQEAEVNRDHHASANVHAPAEQKPIQKDPSARSDKTPIVIIEFEMARHGQGLRDTYTNEPSPLLAVDPVLAALIDRWICHLATGVTLTYFYPNSLTEVPHQRMYDDLSKIEALLQAQNVEPSLIVETLRFAGSKYLTRLRGERVTAHDQLVRDKKVPIGGHQAAARQEYQAVNINRPAPYPNPQQQYSERQNYVAALQGQLEPNGGNARHATPPMVYYPNNTIDQAYIMSQQAGYDESFPPVGQQSYAPPNNEQRQQYFYEPRQPAFQQNRAVQHTVNRNQQQQQPPPNQYQQQQQPPN